MLAAVLVVDEAMNVPLVLAIAELADVAVMEMLVAILIS